MSHEVNQSAERGGFLRVVQDVSELFRWCKPATHPADKYVLNVLQSEGEEADNEKSRPRGRRDDNQFRDGPASVVPDSPC
jgi:hypothetical protein